MNTRRVATLERRSRIETNYDVVNRLNEFWSVINGFGPLFYNVVHIMKLSIILILPR